MTHYSWSRFTLGVIVGTVAISLIAISPDYLFLTVVLLLLSGALLGLAPDKKPETKPFTSDAEEWREGLRGCVQGLPSMAVNAAICVALVLLGQEVVRRYPQIVVDVPLHLLFATFFAALWIRQVIAMYRRGRSTNSAPHSHSSHPSTP